MRMTVSSLLGALLVVLGAGAAQATQYPAPPSTDTLIYVRHMQNPGETPYAVPPDTVWGIAGIITGFDPIATGFAIYIQNRAQDLGGEPAPWTGLDVFTGGNNYIGMFSPPLARGDSIVCYGRAEEFGGETEMVSLLGAFGTPNTIVRRVSIGNSLPAFKVRTVAQLQELPTNVSAEQWEGCLVKVFGPIRVVRTSVTGGLGTNNSFLGVDNVICPPGSLGPCDSLFVDGNTLADPGISPPAVASIVGSVQGIYNQRARGYRIQLRDGADLADNSPPSLSEAHAIAPDSVRVVFDRNLTTASAQNTANYSLASFGTVNSATQQVSPNVVHLRVTNGLGACDPEGVGVSGVVNSANNQTMIGTQSLNFFNGICPITTIQAPDPDSLLVVPCQDRSKFAGPGAGFGGRITTRGVCTMNFGSNYFIQDAAGGARSGILIFAPSTALTVGRQYIVAGAIQEFFTETEIVGTVYIKDEGVVAPPAPVIQTVAALSDTSCDNPGPGLGTQTHSPNGEDYEHVLVKVINVKTTENRAAGQSFFIAQPYPTWSPDTILVDNNVTRTFDPTLAQQLDITGVLDLSFGTWRIQPRSNSDIVPTTEIVGVGLPPPGRVSFTVAPNPARSAQITFALPKRDHVHIAVYDIAGRKLAVLADGEYAAERHLVDWDGRDLEGNALGAGVYFYKMRVGGKTYERRGILIN